jgi:transitional endoplasmic reticulum ATPase
MHEIAVGNIPPALAALLVSGGVVGTPVTGDDIKFHKGKDIVLPEGSTYEWAIDTLERKKTEQETVISFQRVYPFRPDDGAHAVAAVLKSKYGVTIGKPTPGFFSSRPPELRAIAVGFGKTEQVPWGKIEIPSLQSAEITLHETSQGNGPVFAVSVQAARKFKEEIESLFGAIDAELRANSIYRGKALIGAHTLQFLDTSKFDATKIVFSDLVTDTLNAALFGAIKHAAALKRDGVPIKRSVLLYGPYGTGKSSVGMMTAQVAEMNGFTFLQARTGVDSLEDVLKTAQLYQPAVVFVEDIDGPASVSDAQDVAKMLEAFDGVAAKDSQIIMVVTTNHIDRIHAGMLRPGRLDYIVEINKLDRSGTERLLRVLLGDKLDRHVDFDAVFAEMTDFEPAFARATADRAATWAIARTGGKGSYKLATADLVGAARSLHPQLKRLREASEGIPAPQIETALADLTTKAAQEAVLGLRLEDAYGDVTHTVVMPELNGASAS